LVIKIITITIIITTAITTIHNDNRYLETVAVETQFATKFKYHVNPTQEAIALASFFFVFLILRWQESLKSLLHSDFIS